MSIAERGQDFVEHKVFKAKERAALAEKGQAMPGGGFPIRNRQDLKNAIQAYGRAKNKEAAMAWIKKRAKALGLESLLPDAWKETGHAMTFQEFLEHHGVKGQRWGVRRSRRQLRRAAENRTGKALKDMSDQELQALVTRMNLEQQYSRLTGGGRNSNLASTGLKFVGSIGANIARQQITNAANAQIARALKK